MLEILAMTAALAQAAPSPQPLPQHLAVRTIHAPRAALRVQIARTSEQQEEGLMWVRRLPPRTGMVFVFSSNGQRSFWMKNTLVPLDMVFVYANGAVQSVAADVPVVPRDTPDDRVPVRFGTGKYVIELPAGEAAADGLIAGARIPDLPQ